MKLIALASAAFCLLHSHHKQEQTAADISTDFNNEALLPSTSPFPVLTQQLLNSVPVQTKDRLLLKIQDNLLKQIEMDNQILSEFQNLIPVESQPVYEDILNVEDIAGEGPVQEGTSGGQLREEGQAYQSGTQDVIERKHLRNHRHK